MAQSRYVPSSNCSRVDIAECGLLAALLYDRAWLQCDKFGRLEAAPGRLTGTLLSGFGLSSHRISVAEVQEARDKLVAAGAWHLYSVGGREYIEITEFDADQETDWLKKRGARGSLPDPPDREDLWIVNRTKLADWRKKPTDEAAPSTPRPAGVPTAGGTSVTEMPTLGTEQGPVPAEEVERFEPQEPDVDPRDKALATELANDHMRYSARTVNDTDFETLVKVAADAREAGVTVQALLEVMQQCRLEYKATRAKPQIERIGYYVTSWDALVREAKAARASPAAVGTYTADRPKCMDEME